MQDADAALARERDREPRLGDRVHRRGDDRDLERDRARQARRRRDVVRQHRATRPGTSRTSSKVRPSSPNLSSRAREPFQRSGPARHRILHAGSPASADTGCELGDARPGREPPRLARVEAAGTDLERRRGAGGDGEAKRVLARLPRRGGRRGTAARSASPAPTTRPPRRSARRRNRRTLRDPRGRARSSRDSSVMWTLRAPSSAIASSAITKSSSSSSSCPTSCSASRWFGRHEPRLGLEPEPQRLAVRVEDDRGRCGG